MKMLAEASHIGVATLLLSSPAVGLALGSEKKLHEDLPSKILLEIKPSNIPGAGLGLFLASHSPPAKQGTFLTTFGDRVASVLDMYGTILEDYAMQIPDSPEEFRTGEPWTGDVPSVVDGATVAMGHYVNDAVAVAPPIGAWPGPTGLVEMVDSYYAESTRMRNVEFDADAYKGSWALVAMRDIGPCEELYLTYGTSHWLDVVLKTSPDPLLRLLVYLFLQAQRSTGSSDTTAYMVPDENLRPIMADTGEPADESWCQFFLLDTLGMSGKRKEWERYGVYRKKRACDRLSAMIEMAYRDEVMTPQGMEEVVAQG